ncbi:MAG: peptidyl-prolyl cis-trans isomerase [Tannerella sp.]|jgi:hypothetical protein|nr:peptidyl-prolyl cis-trans isomerase [Tannerella sp.]
MMRCAATFFLITSLGFLSACRPAKTGSDEDVLVKVHGNSLYRNDVEKIIPKNISTSDSLLIAENYVKKWIKDILVFDVAQQNIGKEEADINRLVEDYRRSLLRHRYLEYMIRSRLTAEIREDEKMSYYEINTEKFILDKYLIKGLFLKIPIEAPELQNVRKWYKSQDPKELESIEKYSIKNASVYDYFYDRWVDFDEVLDKIPIDVSDKSRYLQSNKTVETKDSTFCYFLNISEYQLPGNAAPYEYADAQILELIINKRKMDFQNTFEEELYQDAIRKGEVNFFTNQK